MALSIGCWQTPPHNLNLGAGQLHLWRIPLNLSPACAVKLKAHLSADELLRAKRLLSTEKRYEFIIARARLRQILAGYLGTGPLAIEFSYNQYGKPSLSTFLQNDLQFNISHSGDWALLGVTRSGDIGVDIEQQDRQLDFLKLATQFFTGEENVHLTRLTEQRLRRGFYRLWALKEAGLKALGHGFSTPSEELSTPMINQRRSLFIAKDYLAAISFSQEVTSIMRYQLIEK